jgi:hypothetical protein
VFRTISLVRVKDEARAPELVDTARRIYSTDPNILEVTVALGRRLLDPNWPQASYSIEMEFESEEAWREFRRGAAHDEMHRVTAGLVDSMITTQYEVPA